MEKMLVAVIFSLASLSVIICDDIPEECKRPPKFTHPHGAMKCCQIPDILSKEDLEDCGIPGHHHGDRPPGGHRPPPRFDNGPPPPPPCEPAICMMNKLNVLNADSTVDAKAVSTFFENLATNNYSAWKPAFDKITQECVENLDNYGPAGFCEPIKFGQCYFVNAFENCPKSSWRNDDECNEWKSYMEKCAKPAFKH